MDFKGEFKEEIGVGKRAGYVDWLEKNSVDWWNLFSSDGVIKVSRKQNEECNKNCILPTVKHGGGSIMVWGSMSYSGVGVMAVLTKSWRRKST